jgi:hypothetical protein
LATRLILPTYQKQHRGHFYDLIQDLYSNTKCAIKLSENRTPFSHTKRKFVKDAF